jgi:hypothetical protein
MTEMKNCYFCGAKAPEIFKEKGAYKMYCVCGAKIEHNDYESVIDLWNYTVR